MGLCLTKTPRADGLVRQANTRIFNSMQIMGDSRPKNRRRMKQNKKCNSHKNWLINIVGSVAV
jgi:hypothetical protein